MLHGVDRDTTAWHLLQGWLEDQASRRPGVRPHRGTEVTAVHPGDEQERATVTTADGGEYPADLVIGADGARSTVRAVVDPDFPDARYAGVLLWRSLVDERALPGPIRERLAGFAAANWPSPWREALTLALYNGTVFGTPIVHYQPKRLARGRAALAGDAAHAASPMVGGGFRQGLYDVAALAARRPRLPQHAGYLAPCAAIRNCGSARPPGTVSERATADYLAHAGAGPAR